MKKSIFVVVIVFVIILLTSGCKPAFSDEASSSEVTESSSSEAESANNKIKTYVTSIELLDNQDGWNRWKFTTTVSYVKEGSKECVIELSLPQNWGPEKQVVDNGQRKEIYYNFKENNLPVKIFSNPFIFNHSDNESWTNAEDKLYFIQSLFESDTPKGGINNSLEFNRVTVNEREWLLRNAWYLWILIQDGDNYENMNYCQMYTVLDNNYELGLGLDIRDKTLEDEETMELITKILESFEFIEIRTVE